MANSIFTRDMFAADGDDVGIFMNDLGSALVTWVAMQNRVGVTVNEAATAFNTTPEVICEAVEYAAWIFENGGVLEIDGE